MSFTAAQQAVVDHLVAEQGPVVWASPPGPGGWVASTRSGGGAGADPATITFRKSRVFPGGQLHAVGFTRRGGRPGQWLARAWQRPDGSWAAAMIGGGEGSGPHRDSPWVNFAAGGNGDQFMAGGEVTGGGAGQAHLVRLTFADGTVAEDTVDNGVVLFCAAGGVTFPARVEILSAVGDVLAGYDDFGELS